MNKKDLERKIVRENGTSKKNIKISDRINEMIIGNTFTFEDLQLFIDETKGEVEVGEKLYFVGEYDDDNFGINVCRERLETDAEYNKRIAKLKELEEKRKKSEEKKLAEERKLYEELQKKFNAMDCGTKETKKEIQRIDQIEI